MPATATLEQLEDKAVPFAEAFGNGLLHATLRVRRVLGDAAADLNAITPAQARRVVAREAGVKDWPAAQRALDLETMSRRQAEGALIEAAFADADDRVQGLLSLWPDLGAVSVPRAPWRSGRRPLPIG